MNEDYKKFLNKKKHYKDYEYDYELGKDYFEDVVKHTHQLSEEITDRMYDNKSVERK